MLANFWSILCESAIYILVGFLLAGLLQTLISSGWVVRLLSGTRKRTVVLATLVGVPLPLCSCSVLPTAVTLRRKGASRGSTLSFLISTPETSATSVLLTYALLGPLYAIFRPIAACVTALAAGLTENFLEKRFPEPDADAAAASGSAEEACADEECCASTGPEPAGPWSARLRGAVRYGFVDLFDDIFGWVLIGVLAAAVLQTWLPPDLLSRVLGGPWQSMLLMIVIGVPLYVCAEASTPIAAVLIAHGMSPGAALVLLLVGPATNIGAVGVLYAQLGRRTVIVYLVTIILVALFMGAILDDLVGPELTELQIRALEEPFVPAWIKTAGAVVFVLLGVQTARRMQYVKRLAATLDANLPIRITRARLGWTAILAVAVGYVASGFYTVQPGEIGIVRRFGAICDDSVPPGLHYALPYPVDEVDRVAVDRVNRLVIGAGPELLEGETVERDADASWMLTGDENIADLRTVVHWGAAAGQALQFQYGTADREALVRRAVQAATREVLGEQSITTVLTAQRRSCQESITHLTQQRLDAYGTGIRVYAVDILDAHAPPEVHAAFRDVASALEDRAAKIDQARRDEARVVPLARGEGQRRMAESQGYAARTTSVARGEAERFLSVQQVYAEWPDVTSRRLEFEMLEEVLPHLRKYLRPAGVDDGELEIWFADPDLVETFAP